ncbi:hypothetical protein Ahy_B10g106042 [Arachis hypogaea]|uniref:Myb/SANT-like domain-containing protein n=1 Tax=Arachis hypogaea TaxID=3818 RepID=A0A444X9Y0_ARAHY|nr:hypothetical protein Ahy_B10g106042 [Arachis hypogaea]
MKGNNLRQRRAVKSTKNSTVVMELEESWRQLVSDAEKQRREGDDGRVKLVGLYFIFSYIMPNKGNKTAEANQPSKDNLRWSDDMDEVLLNALAEEASKGNRHDGSWTTETYANIE